MLIIGSNTGRKAERQITSLRANKIKGAISNDDYKVIDTVIFNVKKWAIIRRTGANGVQYPAYLVEVLIRNEDVICHRVEAMEDNLRRDKSGLADGVFAIESL